MNAYDSFTEGPIDVVDVTFTDFIKFVNHIFKPSTSIERRISISNGPSCFRSKHQQRLLIKALEHGSWPFCLPWGLQRKDDGNGKSFIVPSEQSRFVVQAFNWRYFEKATYSEISTRLAAMGCIKKPYTVDQTLRNPLYMGVLEFDNKKYKAEFKPLITQEIFDGVQMQATKRIRQYRESDEGNFPLNYFVRIADSKENCLVGYRRLKNDNIFFYYKHSLSQAPIKLNQSAVHIHNLFQRVILKKINDESEGERIKRLKAVHKTIKRFIILIIPHMNAELQLTKSQLLQSASDKASNAISYFLEERKKSAIYQITTWKAFLAENEFVEFSNLMISQSSSWGILEIDSQKEIQKILFPRGIIYDPTRDILLPV